MKLSLKLLALFGIEVLPWRFKAGNTKSNTKKGPGRVHIYGSKA